MYRGGCNCGAVRFEVPHVPAPDACHCSICRKFSGHYFVSADVPKSDLKIEGADSITWYDSSNKVRRGFCKTCGSSLFFAPPHLDWIAIAMGAFDSPTDTKMNMHIFTDDKGDYYEIKDGLPQNPQ